MKLLTLLALILTSCSTAIQDPCTPLWGTAIAGSTLAASGVLLERAETDQTARDVEQITVIVLSSGAVIAVGEAARCEGKRK